MDVQVHLDIDIFSFIYCLQGFSNAFMCNEHFPLTSTCKKAKCMFILVIIDIKSRKHPKDHLRISTLIILPRAVIA